MSITGAANLAGSIKNKIAAAKARVANVTQNTDLALEKLHKAADLMAELGQFSNGAPDEPVRPIYPTYP